VTQWRRLTRGIIAGLGLVVALAAEAKDVESRVVAIEIPKYPAVARRAKISGTAEVIVSVDGSGETVVQAGKSTHKMLEQAAVMAAQKWKLRLAQGETVTIKFRFTLLPACSIPEFAQLYTPPFSAEVFASEQLPWVDDGEQLTCPQVSISVGASQ
jgi:TonB family protein